MASRSTGRAVTERVSFGVDARDLKKFGQVMRTIGRDTRREFRTVVRATAEVVATEARERASFSPKIAATIKARSAGASAFVQAGSNDVPEAALLELGNHGDRRSATPGGGTFRHPVFGNREVWVDQPMRPYLAPAGEAKQAEALEVFERGINKLFEDHDLRFG